MEKAQFIAATNAVVDQLGLSLRSVAKGLRISAPTLTQWRTEGNRFQPRSNWRLELARFIREVAALRRRQAAAGDRLVEELDPDGSGSAAGPTALKWRRVDPSSGELPPRAAIPGEGADGMGSKT